VVTEESDEKSNKRLFLGTHKLGKFGSGLFLKPLWASCELKFGRKRLRVFGDEVKQQILYGVEPLLACALLGTNRTNFVILVTPRRKRSLADAVLASHIGERCTSQDGGDRFGSKRDRVRDTAGHSDSDSFASRFGRRGGSGLPSSWHRRQSLDLASGFSVQPGVAQTRVVRSRRTSWALGMRAPRTTDGLTEIRMADVELAAHVAQPVA